MAILSNDVYAAGGMRLWRVQRYDYSGFGGLCEAIAIHANTSTIMIQCFKNPPPHTAGYWPNVLVYFSPTDVGILDLNTITAQCAAVNEGQLYTFNIGPERKRTTPGYLYVNWRTGAVPAARGWINIAQVLENY